MDIVSRLSDLAWSPGIVLAFMAAGLFVSAKLGFFQLKAAQWLRGMTLSDRGGKGQVSPWRAAATALGGALGTGNISGVAWAVVLGGPGAIFWMWVSAFVGMGLSYAEKALTIMYTKKHPSGPIGGAMCYIEKALGRGAGVFYCAVCLCAIYTGGCMTQSNAMCGALSALTGGGNAVIGLAVAAALIIVCAGGIERTSSLSAVLVPAVSILYIAAGGAALFKARHCLGSVFSQIVRCAFTMHPAAAGISAVTAMRHGFARGIFSSEAGVGSATIPHASAQNSSHGQGCWGIFEVFLDTAVICTFTGLIILSSGFYGSSLTGEALTAAAFTPLLGSLAAKFIALCISVLAFSTLISRAWCARQCIRYIFKGRCLTFGADALFALLAFGGALLPSRTLWDLSDVLNIMLALPNLAALCLLVPKTAVFLPSKVSTAGNLKFLKK